ncbi:NUDIX hydrolase [Nocardioides insulae]|uniref:NUDIX hydrolase n=1 Tax=Nocardioides insulae TaxID=394734 RepID=UPI0003F6F509|nr:NUDIX domain-containing protein [Nocardioides insulae]
MTLPDYTEYDTRLAAYAVIVEPRDGVEHLLLALWKEGRARRWTLPGGGVELRESVEDGVIREVREESGYDVALDGLLGLDTRVFEPVQRRSGSDRHLKAVRILYRAHVVGGELTQEIDATTEEARWVPLVEVRRLPRVQLVDVAVRLHRSDAGR